MDFLQFARIHGLIIDHLEIDRWVRVKTEDHPRKKNGAYFYGGDYGHVQNWATMIEVETWMTDRVMTPKDHSDMQRRMAEARAAQAKERARNQAAAATKAKKFLALATIEEHAYLHSKGVGLTGGLVYYPDSETNLLLVPMRVDGEVVGCQTINRYGEKKFLFGQRCHGAEYLFDGSGIDVWCEGYATGLSIKACLAALKVPCRVHCTFSAANLEAMAKEAGKGVIVIDHDRVNKMTGKRAGHEAAAAAGLPFFMPPEEGMDFNDYHQAVGTLKAGMDLRKFIMASQRKLARSPIVA